MQQHVLAALVRFMFLEHAVYSGGQRFPALYAQRSHTLDESDFQYGAIHSITLISEVPRILTDSALRYNDFIRHVIVGKSNR